MDTIFGQITVVVVIFFCLSLFQCRALIKKIINIIAERKKVAEKDLEILNNVYCKNRYFIDPFEHETVAQIEETARKAFERRDFGVAFLALKKLDRKPDANELQIILSDAIGNGNILLAKDMACNLGRELSISEVGELKQGLRTRAEYLKKSQCRKNKDLTFEDLFLYLGGPLGGYKQRDWLIFLRKIRMYEEIYFYVNGSKKLPLRERIRWII